MTTELLEGLASGAPDFAGVPEPRFSPSELARILGEKNHPYARAGGHYFLAPLTSLGDCRGRFGQDGHHGGPCGVAGG